MLVTVIFSYVEPPGTITVRLPAEATVTVALVAPKKTAFCAGFALKPLPDSTTAVPTGPLAGEKLLIMGAANTLIANINVAESKVIIFIGLMLLVGRVKRRFILGLVIIL